MPAYIALPRAVNVVGKNTLPMTELKAMCEAAGFKSVRTYIASGNVVFKSSKSEAKVKAALEAALLAFTGKPVCVLVRTAAEMAAVLVRNPFAEMRADHTLAIFLDAPPPPGAHEDVARRLNEQISLGEREIYVYYPEGQGKSRLNIRAAQAGTGRNMNTVAKLAEMATSLLRE